MTPKRADSTPVPFSLAFAVTIFAGATLLFACQPMIARMIVPLLGGAPAVWIVCSLCFQTLLLAGYGYAHLSGTRLPVRGQVVLQLLLVGAVFLVLPISVDEALVARLTGSHPTFGVCFLILRTVGLPFFVLSTSSPLLQRWFAELGERDPYHLYAASNAGSMVALLGYPLIIEPLLPVPAQSRTFQTAFAVYTVLVVACATVAIRRRAPVRVDATPAPPQVRVSSSVIPVADPSPRDRFTERLLWIGLSFAPSSLLMGATEYVTTEIASVPLLWVLPLALYLLSFIVAFAKKQVVAPSIVARGLAFVAAIVAALTLADIRRPSWLLVGAHMLLLFVASVVCHRGLAERRPRVDRLTEFYLSMSVGGVLGGAFNGLLAPTIFDDLVEYPVAIGLVCLGRAVLDPNPVDRRALARDVAYGALVGLVTLGLVKLVEARRLDQTLALSTTFGWMFIVPILVAMVWSKRPLRFAVAIVGLLFAGMAHGGDLGTTLWADRGFFGVLKVMRDRDNRFLLLVSGRSLQGKQALEPSEAVVPLAYYHPTGPAGDVLGPLPRPDFALPPRRIGVIGLGIGSLASYARPGDAWTFFEINPEVIEVARRQFTYLKRAETSPSPSARIDIETGDARLRLKEGAAARFDVLVLDAFSGDAVPIHLVTREALVVYRRALRPGGLLLAHVSNEHIRLRPVFAALARQAGLVAIGRRDEAPSAAERAAGKMPSDWLVLTEARSELDVLVRTGPWRPLSEPSSSVWTDDYANVLGAIRF